MGPMKTLILLSLLVGSTSAFSKAFFCSKQIINESVALARKHGSNNDKNMHCTTSCLMALRCSTGNAYTIGILKEIKDIFGPGKAEMADLKADRLGIELVKYHRVRNKTECLVQCDSYYSPN